MKDYEFITVEKEDRICYITLDRPGKRNAFNQAMVGELKEAFGDSEKDKECKVIVLRARGKAFSAGADLGYLQMLQKNNYEDNLEDSRHLKELFKMMYDHPKVIIAQVEGAAVAGGCGLITVCDFVYAVPEAKFGYTEVKIGFIPAIVMFFLLRKIGETKAREMLLTGKLIQAREAAGMGIVSRIVEKDKIAGQVKEFAGKLCRETSGDSVRMAREQIARVQSLDVDEALELAAEYNARARETSDCKKGIAAFLNKEKIQW